MPFPVPDGFILPHAFLRNNSYLINEMLIFREITRVFLHIVVKKWGRTIRRPH